MATKVTSNPGAEQNEYNEKPQGKIIEINAASVALAAAVNAQKPSLWSKNMIKLYGIMAVGYLVSTMNGFDSSLMGAINAMKPYQDSFGLSGEGRTSYTECTNFH